MQPHDDKVNERYVSLCELPQELIVKICHLAEKDALSRLCLTSNHLRNTAQPILFEDLDVEDLQPQFIRVLRRRHDLAQLTRSATFRSREYSDYSPEDVAALCKEVGNAGPHDFANFTPPSPYSRPSYWGNDIAWTLIIEQVLCLLPNLKVLTLISAGSFHETILHPNHFDPRLRERLPALRELIYIDKAKWGSMRFIAHLMVSSARTLEQFTADSLYFANEDFEGILQPFESLHTIRLVEREDMGNVLRMLLGACPNLIDFQWCLIRDEDDDQSDHDSSFDGENVSASDIVTDPAMNDSTLESLSLTTDPSAHRSVSPSLRGFTALKHLRLDTRELLCWNFSDSAMESSATGTEWLSDIILRLVPSSLETLWLDNIYDADPNYQQSLIQLVIAARHRLRNLKEIIVEGIDKMEDEDWLCVEHSKASIAQAGAEIIPKPRGHYWYIEKNLHPFLQDRALRKEERLCSISDDLHSRDL